MKELLSPEGKYGGEVCPKCGEYYEFATPNQNQCQKPGCKSYGDFWANDVVWKLNQYQKTLKEQLDSRVINLDPKQWEQGVRKVLR